MAAQAPARAGGRGAAAGLTEARLSQDLGGQYNNSFIEQCSAPVFLSISVVDQPDLDPQFVRELYSASVAEDAPKVCRGLGWGRRGLGGDKRQRKGLAH